MFKNLTEQEKFEFANNIYSDKSQKQLKYGKRYIISGYIWGIGGALAISIVLILNIFRASFFLPLALFMWVDFTGLDLYRGYRATIRTVKDAGYGKISYREYKQLVKSGELKQWLTGGGKVLDSTLSGDAQATIHDGSVQLSAEEVAVLKKLMEKQGVTSAYNLRDDSAPPSKIKRTSDHNENS